MEKIGIQTEIGNRIRALRKELRMTQKEFGEYIGIVQQAVSRYEKGKKGFPNLTALISISEKTGVSLDSLVFGNNYNNNLESVMDDYVRFVMDDYVRLSEDAQHIVRDIIGTYIKAERNNRTKKYPSKHS